jgi:phosphatidate cytidylyltransferase
MKRAMSEPPEYSAPADATKKRAASDLPARVLTAVVAIPLVALVIFQGGWLFFAVTTVLALLALGELAAAARQSGTPLAGFIAYPALLLLLVGALLPVWPGSAALQTAFGFRDDLLVLFLPWLILLALLIAAVLRYAAPQRLTLASLALTVLAVFYVSLFAFLPLLRAYPLGLALVWLTLLGVWAGDTFAYFAGRAFGRRKITPLSPGKSWEGALAGFIAAVLTGAILGYFTPVGARHGTALGVLVGFTAPLGDLAASFWKRELGVKDWGRLLPGHGGVLDRCDSLLFAFFVAYLYAVWRL